MNNKSKHIGITDFSMITPLGNNLEQISDNLFSDDINKILSGMKVDDSYLKENKTIIGLVNYDFEIDIYQNNLTSELNSKYNYRAIHMILKTLSNIADSINSLRERYPRNKIGVVLGTSTAGVDYLEKFLPEFDKTGKWNSKYHKDQQRMGSVAEFIATYLELTAPALSISTACSSSAKAIATGKRWIETGICDAVITGGVDVLCDLTLKGFDSLGALSYKQCLPFSKNRDGINIGEGCALFILENKESEFYILGTGESSDAHHISAPDPSGSGAINSMQMAIKNANLTLKDINYINLHGTGTKQNDAMESKAVSLLFKDSNPLSSSSKSLIGHTLGASGAIEMGLSLLSMSKYNSSNKYLPHIYDNSYDDEINKLNLVPLINNLGKPKVALSNSFAFGGSNASLVFGSL